MTTIDREPPVASPPLSDGQRLDRATFHERYEAMPPEFRAELIGGVVHVMTSPLRRRHGAVSARAALWLGMYSARTPGVQVFHDASTLLDDEAEPQPDLSMRIAPEFGGQTHDVGKYIGGAPELIVEVSDTSRAIDLGPKLADYERAGILEYVVVALDPDDVFWHVRRGDRFVRVAPDPDGLHRSEVFPGLWLDPRALLVDDTAALLAALERGLATPEHGAYVARLDATRRTPDSPEA
ncbi:MAG: Uma2 family endonuclease [Planctomycetaceae bacterium]|nr:Uma2 family endonuclease [Planctomycetaceae bacterium]MBV8265696.1 Uma2 family endonuclease [Planctomycetaceae bacterium]MBV8384342.1 Uma2 family endonuclease [Planctomycetaceae bacterium]MBV8606028.1 Uma2 family endonuclease [Singulisphaera sp.]